MTEFVPGATAEEIAAVLAALAQCADRGPGPDPYERWRRTRLAAGYRQSGNPPGGRRREFAGRRVASKE